MQGASSTLRLQLLLTVGTNTAPYRVPSAAPLEQAQDPRRARRRCPEASNHTAPNRGFPREPRPVEAHFDKARSSRAAFIIWDKDNWEIRLTSIFIPYCVFLHILLRVRQWAASPGAL